MSDEPNEASDSIERPQCEECWTAFTCRACHRCGRRICRKCARRHRMGPVTHVDLSEDAQPLWCAPLTSAEARALSRLPLQSREIKADTYRRSLWWRLIQKRYVRWSGNVLVRVR